MSIRCLSLVEQTAGHLRAGLRAGRWRGQLPGVVRLSRELGISTHTLRAALRVIEAEGLLAMSADGRSREVPEKLARRKRPLRIGILLFEPLAEECGQTVEMYLGLHHALEREGFTVFFSEETQAGLGYDVARIARYLLKAKGDAWIVASGSRALLEWCAGQAVPCLALFGRRAGLPLAAVGLDKTPAFAEVTRQLLDLGHCRIVMICRRVPRLPEPNAPMQAFLDELAAHGSRMAGYHLPDWEETPEGLAALLDGFFRGSPPTALIVDEVSLFIAAERMLAARGLRVPAQVSLVCTEFDAALHWCRPTVAHMRWQAEPMVRRILRWANAVSRHVRDVKQTDFRAEYVPGGTVGPAPRG